MSVHEYSVRTVVHHEFRLREPAHISDVEKAILAADRARAPFPRAGDLYVRCDDEHVVVTFSVEER